MAGAFAWLNKLIHSFGQLFPRILLVRKTYAAVYFRWNGKVTIKQPGLTWYWPIATDIRLIPITIRNTQVKVGVVETKEGPYGVPVCVSCDIAMQWQIESLSKAIELYNIGETVAVIATKAGARHWPLQDAAIEEINAKCGQYGVAVSDVAFVNINEWASHGAGMADDHGFHRWLVQEDKDTLGSAYGPGAR